MYIITATKMKKSPSARLHHKDGWMDCRFEYSFLKFVKISENITIQGGYYLCCKDCNNTRLRVYMSKCSSPTRRYPTMIII